MKILLLGKNGQVGWELQRALAPLGELIALDRHSHINAIPSMTGDVSNLEGLRLTIQTIKPNVIVNASAYTAVDKAETERELADTINHLAPQVMAQEAKQLNALLVHYSTDYVFNGQGTSAWQEDDNTGPINYYGVSKLAGEQAIINSGCQHLIFRTSWVYATKGQNFIGSMQRLMTERDALSIVSDQMGVPTSAELIADVTAHAIPQTLQKPNKSGVYHLAAQGETHWQQYAVFIAEQLQKLGIALKTDSQHIKAIASSEFPTPAKRPLNSRLNCHKLQQTFNVTMPPWQLGVVRAISERNALS